PEFPPLFQDFVRNVKEAFEMKDYQGEIRSNLAAAIEIRLQPLCRGTMGQIFNTRSEIPPTSELINEFSIIELDGLSKQNIGLFILFHLNHLRQVVSTTEPKDQQLGPAIMIDEAHIVAPENQGTAVSEDSVDTTASSGKVIESYFAEIRKHRVPMILADQSPSRVSSNISRLGGSTIALRTTDRLDREILGGAMNFSEYELEQLLTLNVGEGFLFTKGCRRPQRFQTVPPPDEILSSPPFTDKELDRLLSTEKWVIKNKQLNHRDDLDRCEQALNSSETDLSHVLLKIKETLTALNERLESNRVTTRFLTRTLSRIKDFRDNTSKISEDLQKDFHPVLCAVSTVETDPNLVGRQMKLRDRFEKQIRHKVHKNLEVFDRLIPKLEDLHQ
ncbi:MAG: ATP-binding protein, partial [Candidatus Omnitrophica bacterium]|nr:ATP-binding protein [Candidatus Omnitrophota bacterium]